MVQKIKTKIDPYNMKIKWKEIEMNGENTQKHSTCYFIDVAWKNSHKHIYIKHKNGLIVKVFSIHLPISSNNAKHKHNKWFCSMNHNIRHFACSVVLLWYGREFIFEYEECKSKILKLQEEKMKEK